MTLTIILLRDKTNPRNGIRAVFMRRMGSRRTSVVNYFASFCRILLAAFD